MASYQFYVATDGSNTNDGLTLSTTFRTITYTLGVAAPLLTAGHSVTIDVRGGVYQERVNIQTGGTSSSVLLELRNFQSEVVYLDGRADTGIEDPAPGTGTVAQWNAGGANRVLPNVTTAKCSLVYTQRCMNHAGLLTVGASHVKVRGINTRYSKGRGISVNGTSVTQQISDVRIENCTAYKSHSNGVAVLFCTDVILSSVHTQHAADYAPYPRDPNVENWPGGFSTNQCSFVTLLDCTSYNGWCEGFIVNSDSDEVLAINCGAWSCMQDLMYIHRCSNSTIIDCYAYHETAGGYWAFNDRSVGLSLNNEPNSSWAQNIHDVLIMHFLGINTLRNLFWQNGAQGQYPFTRVKIYNSVFVNAISDTPADEANCIRVLPSGTHIDSEIRNCIFIQDTGTIDNLSTIPAGLTIRNCLFSATPSSTLTNPATNPYWNTILTGAPLLVAHSTVLTDGALNKNNYKIGNGASPAIGAGASIATTGITNDTFGNSWDDPPSIGFHEYSPPTEPPPASTSAVLAEVGISAVTAADGQEGPFTLGDFGDETPKAGLVFGTNATEDGGATDDLMFSVGAFDATNQWYITERSKHGNAATENRSWGETGYCVALMKRGSNAIDFKARMSSLITNGFYLTKDGLQTASCNLAFALFGGSGLVAQTFVVACNATATQTVDVALTGFTVAPNMIFLFSHGRALDNAVNTDIYLTIGVATATGNQFCYHHFLDHNLTTTNLEARLDSGIVARKFAGTDQTHDITAISASAITIRTNAAAGARTLAGLALYVPVDVYAGIEDTPTATGNNDHNTMAFEPLIAGIFTTLLQATGSQINSADAGGWGAALITANQRANVALAFDDGLVLGGSTLTNTQSNLASTPITLAQDSGAAGITATFDSIQATGPRLNYTAVLGAARKHLWWAIEKVTSQELTINVATLVVFFSLQEPTVTIAGSPIVEVDTLVVFFSLQEPTVSVVPTPVATRTIRLRARSRTLTLPQDRDV